METEEKPDLFGSSSEVFEQNDILSELKKDNNLMVNYSADDALLPPGIHNLSMEDLYEKTVTNFQQSKRRKLLYYSLCNFLNSLPNIQIIKELWIDGSFLTQKNEPNDIDILLILNETIINQINHEDQNTLLTLLDNHTIRYTYMLDCYHVAENNHLMISYWRGWFGFKRDNKTAKGIASIEVKL